MPSGASFSEVYIEILMSGRGWELAMEQLCLLVKRGCEKAELCRSVSSPVICEWKRRLQPEADLRADERERQGERAGV